MNFLVVLPYEEFLNKLTGILNQVFQEKNEKMCYITLNKPFMEVHRSLNDAGFNDDRLFVIDGVTKTVLQNPPEFPNCTYIDAPSDMEGLITALRRILNEEKPATILLDSLSTFLVYSSQEEAFKTSHDILVTSAMAGAISVLTCLRDDAESEAVEKIKKVVDRVILL